METLWLLQLLFNLVMLAGLFVLARGQGTRRRRRPEAAPARRGLLHRFRLPLRRRRPPREKGPEAPAGPAPRIEVPSVLADLVAEAERREEMTAERALRERLAAFRAREAS